MRFLHSVDNNPERIGLSAFQEATLFAWITLRVYEAALNRDEKQLRMAARGLEEYFQLNDDGVSDTNEGKDANSALIQVAFIANKVVQKRFHMIPHFTEEIGSLETLTSGIRSSWEFDNLLGAAYLQMWWLMTSGEDVTRCEYCRRIMSLARPHPNGRKRRRD
jgi:hypothetical protein